MTISGFDAVGKPIPMERRSNALRHVREMCPGITTESATKLVGEVTDALERDQPYEAQECAMEWLDLTGTYRLMAALLT